MTRRILRAREERDVNGDGHETSVYRVTVLSHIRLRDARSRRVAVYGRKAERMRKSGGSGR